MLWAFFMPKTVKELLMHFYQMWRYYLLIKLVNFGKIYLFAGGFDLCTRDRQNIWSGWIKNKNIPLFSKLDLVHLFYVTLNFKVDFEKDNAKIDIKGIGGKLISKITNKGIKAIGNKIIDMQKEVIDEEIKNILWGMVKCLMYQPGTVSTNNHT